MNRKQEQTAIQEQVNMGEGASLWKRCLAALRRLTTWQYFASVALMLVMLVMGVNFMNAGHSYEQAVPFRKYCICFALLILVNVNPRAYLNWWTLGYTPVCYVFMHYAYLRHWIPDTCNYEFVDVIRLGKAVALVWGWMLIALLREVIRKRLVTRGIAALTRLRWPQRIYLLLWALYVVVLTISNPGYYYVVIFTLGFSSYFILCRDHTQRRRTLDAYLDAALLAFFYVSYKSLRHRPYDTERYLMYFANENMGGMYLSTVAVVMAVRLTRLWRERRSWVRTLRLIAEHMVSAWLGILIMYNYTRSYILGLLFALFVYFLILLRRRWRKRARSGGKVVARLVGRFALPFVLTLLLMWPGYLIIRYLPAYAASPTYFAAEYDNQTRVHPGDPIDSPHYTTIQRYLTLSFGKWGINLHIADDGYAPEAEEGEGIVTINTSRDLSNGRTYIWKQFLSRLALRGHYPGHLVVEEDRIIYHAHNTYLQNAYQYGLPAGLLYLLLIVGGFCIAVVRVSRDGKRKKGQGSDRSQAVETSADRQGSRDCANVYALLALGLMMIGMMTEWSGHPIYHFGLQLMLVLRVVLSPE